MVVETPSTPAAESTATPDDAVQPEHAPEHTGEGSDAEDFVVIATQACVSCPVWHTQRTQATKTSTDASMAGGDEEHVGSVKGHSRTPSAEAPELTYSERIEILLRTGTLAEQFNHLVNRPMYLSTMKNEVRALGAL